MSTTLYREVDALGGAVSTDWDAGYSEAIRDVLEVLAKRNFREDRDPVSKAALALMSDVNAGLVSALSDLADVFALDGEGSTDRFDRLASMFYKDTGYLAPGKSQSMLGPEQPDGDELRALYDTWYVGKVTRARAAVAKAVSL